MGTDIHMYILAEDNGEWKPLKLFRKKEEEFKYVPPYLGRNSELFDILSGKEVEEDWSALPINENLLPLDLKQEINEKFQISGYYGFNEINLADLQLYILKYPQVRDYDYEPKNERDFDLYGWKDNPLKKFFEIIENYIFFADNLTYYAPLSHFKIIYWFDY
jgi:hypothetical protein